MANISTENINTLAQLAASVSDGDYIYIYKATSNSFARVEKSVFMAGIEAGLSPDDIINNLNSTATDKALAAAQGNTLKSKINEVYSALQSVYAALGASAFWGEKTPVSTMLPDLDWASTKYTVSISNSNANLVIKRNGTPIEVSSFQVDEGTSVTLTFEGATNYSLQSVSVNGTNLSISNNSATYSFVVNGNMTLTITSETASVPNPITVSKTLNGCTASDETSNPYVGGPYSVTINPPSGGSITSVNATMAGGGTLSVTDAQNGAKTIGTLNVTGDITIVVTAENVFVKKEAYAHGDNVTATSILTNSTNHRRNTNYIPLKINGNDVSELLYVFGSENLTQTTWGMHLYTDASADSFVGSISCYNRCGYRKIQRTNMHGANYVRCTFMMASAYDVYVRLDGTAGLGNNWEENLNKSNDSNYYNTPFALGLYGRVSSSDAWTLLFSAPEDNTSE